jgi:Fic family protein
LRALENTLRHAPNLNHRQQALIGHALCHPGMRYTVAGHQRSHGIVYETARKDLLDLQKAGFLDLRRNGKAFVFITPSDLADRVHRATRASR